MSGIQGKLCMLGHSMTELLTIAQLKRICQLKICCSIKKNCDIMEKMAGNPDWNKKDRWIFYYGRLLSVKEATKS